VVIGIIIGFVMATLLFLATTAVQIKKQGYEQKMQDQQQKHSIEKMVFSDRIHELEKTHIEEIRIFSEQIKELEKKDDVEGLYTNNKGFYTHKKAAAEEEED
jgi:uncharacterized membrane protein YgaE (UPF0421/DUF939 family)